MNLVPEKEYPEAINMMPTTDLSADITQCLGAIALVGKRSGNLHGKFQGLLNRAVNNIALAISALTVRLLTAKGNSDSSSKIMEEIKELRAEVKASRAETESVQAKLRRLQLSISLATAALPPHGSSPPPPPTWVPTVGPSSKVDWPVVDEAAGRPHRKKREARHIKSLSFKRNVSSKIEVDIPSFDDELAQNEACPPVGAEPII